MKKAAVKQLFLRELCSDSKPVDVTTRVKTTANNDAETGCGLRMDFDGTVVTAPVAACC